jgi:hypothetical protein
MSVMAVTKRTIELPTGGLVGVVARPAAAPKAHSSRGSLRVLASPSGALLYRGWRHWGRRVGGNWQQIGEPGRPPGPGRPQALLLGTADPHGGSWRACERVAAQ